jgi:hypothetical protein
LRQYGNINNNNWDAGDNDNDDGFASYSFKLIRVSIYFLHMPPPTPHTSSFVPCRHQILSLAIVCCHPLLLHCPPLAACSRHVSRHLLLA